MFALEVVGEIPGLEDGTRSGAAKRRGARDANDPIRSVDRTDPGFGVTGFLHHCADGRFVAWSVTSSVLVPSNGLDPRSDGLHLVASYSS